MGYTKSELRRQRRRYAELSENAERAHFETIVTKNDPCSTIDDILGAENAERLARQASSRQRRKLFRIIDAFALDHGIEPSRWFRHYVLGVLLPRPASGRSRRALPTTAGDPAHRP